MAIPLPGLLGLVDVSAIPDLLDDFPAAV